MTVYLFRAGESGPVKIGWVSANWRARLTAIQANNHEEIIVLRTLPGGPAVEKHFHERYQHLHRRREWFEFDPDMLTYTPPDLEEPAYFHRRVADWERSKCRSAALQ